MAWLADMRFMGGVMTIFVTLICVRFLLWQGIFHHPFPWLTGRVSAHLYRREAVRLTVPGVMAHISDGAGYWRGVLVDISEHGLCLALEGHESFSGCEETLGVLLEKDGRCLPVRTKLKWKREGRKGVRLGLIIDDHLWSWHEFKDKMGLISTGRPGESHG